LLIAIIAMCNLSIYHQRNLGGSVSASASASAAASAAATINWGGDYDSSEAPSCIYNCTPKVTAPPKKCDTCEEPPKKCVTCEVKVKKPPCDVCDHDSDSDDDENVVILQVPYPVPVPYEVPQQDSGPHCIDCDTHVEVPVEVHVSIEQCDTCHQPIITTPQPEDKIITTHTTTTTTTTTETITITTEEYIPGEEESPIVATPPCDCHEEYEASSEVSVEIPSGCQVEACVETHNPCDVCEEPPKPCDVCEEVHNQCDTC
jgi:hypothetical protein